MDIEDLIARIVQCAYDVRLELTSGFLESVYKNALIHEIKSQGLDVEAEVPIKVYFKGVIVGEFRADLIVEGQVIIELKAIESLNVFHEVQLVNYLTATGIDNGLLINFGSNKIQIKRKYRLAKP